MRVKWVGVVGKALLEDRLLGSEEEARSWRIGRAKSTRSCKSESDMTMGPSRKSTGIALSADAVSSLLPLLSSSPLVALVAHTLLTSTNTSLAHVSLLAGSLREV